MQCAERKRDHIIEIHGKPILSDSTAGTFYRDTGFVEYFNSSNNSYTILMRSLVLGTVVRYTYSILLYAACNFFV